jgi:hypothetical protein
MEGDDRFQFCVRPPIVNPTQHDGARQPVKHGSFIAYQCIHDWNAFFRMVRHDRCCPQDGCALLDIQIRQSLI